MDLKQSVNDEKKDKASKNKNEDSEIKITDTITTKNMKSDDKKTNDEVKSSNNEPDEVKPLKKETMEVEPANKETVEVKPNKETVDLKPPKRSPDNEDITMAPPAKVSRLLEKSHNEKKIILLKIENIPGTFEETGKIIKQFLETEFGADSDLNLEKEQTDKQTNIILKIQNDEDAAAVYEKLNDFNIDGKSLSVKKHYDIPKVVPVDLFDEDYEGTYGLSEDFLKELEIKLPLTKWIHVTNTNCQRNILMELMEYAGKVLYCNVIHTKTPYAKIMFSHPLEAVQAISLFNQQTFYGRLITVTMVQAPPNEGLLPKGVQKIGTGFGPDGGPLRDLLKQFERYYNGEKCYINYSVLESEKHKVPVVKKLDKETALTEKETKVAKKEEKIVDKKEEKKEDKKEDKKVEQKEVIKKYTSVTTQTYALPSKLIQKMADLIKKGITVANINKALDRLADDDEDVVVITANDKDKKFEKGKGKRERPRSVSPVAAKSAAKQPFKTPAKGPATTFRPQKPISTRFTQSSCNPVTPNKFNNPSFNNSSNSQQQSNNFIPNNNFDNNQQPPFNSGANNMGGFDHGNRNPNMGMMQNMGQNMQMGQQNMGMGPQNMPMGQQNMPIQQNVPIMQQNMPQPNISPMGQQNMSMAQQNMAMGQHNNMGQNNMNPFNALNQVVSMVNNAAGNLPMGQAGHMGLGQMGHMGQGGQPMGQGGQQMGQSGQMAQGGAMGQSGFQNQQVLLGQGTADFLVLVSNLPQSVTFKLLREKMSSCGEVKFLKMTNPGCAVVGYGELWEAQRCVAAFNKTVVDGHKVELRMM